MRKRLRIDFAIDREYNHDVVSNVNYEVNLMGDFVYENFSNRRRRIHRFTYMP